MALINAFSYWEQRDIPTMGSSLPKSSNLLFTFEDATNNINAAKNRWTDTSGKGYVTGIIESGSATSGPIAVATGSLQLNTSGTTAVARFRVTTNSDIAIKSLAIVYNTIGTQLGTTSTRNYFWDMRSANAESPNNDGYFNQYDSVGQNTYSMWYSGSYYSYNDSTTVTDGPLVTDPTNLTNGINNSSGGSASYQWLGPNGKAAYYPKRLWLFNFSSTKDLNLTTTATKGLIFGSADNYTQGSRMGIFSIVGWNTYLDSTDLTQLINYYKSTGVLTP